MRSVSAHDQTPMLATLQEMPPSGAQWIFEIKYDGVRVIAARDRDNVDLYGRNGTVITPRYPEICRGLTQIPVDNFVIDGEIIACDEQGLPSFQRLQPRMHLTNQRDVERAMAVTPVDAIFFDCLALNGRDLRGIPLIERKELLQELLPNRGRVRYTDYFTGDGRAFLNAASELGLEGIVAKKADSHYVGTRSHAWLKIKSYRSEEFVIGGYTDPQGGRGRFGALHLGLYEGERLVYISKVGSGFDRKLLESIWQKMQPLRRESSPFAERSPSGRNHHWTQPQLVCAVRFSDWTTDGGIRHPVFLGLRDDKNPLECRK